MKDKHLTELGKSHKSNPIPCANGKYIYRYKDSGISVWPSRRDSEEQVWQFAIEWLRPAGMGDEEAERFMRETGEVVVDDDE